MAERRVIPLVGSVETRTITLLEELLLGPADHSHIAVMPATTRLLAVMHRGNLLIVNLAVDALQGFTIDFPRIYEALEKTLLSGIPGYGSLELFINGKLTSK